MMEKGGMGWDGMGWGIARQVLQCEARCYLVLCGYCVLGDWKDKRPAGIPVACFAWGKYSKTCLQRNILSFNRPGEEVLRGRLGGVCTYTQVTHSRETPLLTGDLNFVSKA